MELSQEFVDRYSRQLILNEVTVEGQKKLTAAKILIVGAGGLGCPVALYCCAAGIGCIGVVDNDVVEVSNLHRQICHDVQHIGISKVESLWEKLKSLNPHVDVRKHILSIDRSNVSGVLEEYDVIVDCTDNAQTRYLLSDACVCMKKILVSASALRFEGQLTVYRAFEPDKPCYRCIFPDPPDPAVTGNCSSMGVMGFVCGVMGSLQAQEVIKTVVGLPNVLIGKMLLYDSMSLQFRTINLRPKSSFCPCSLSPKTLDAFKPVVFECSVSTNCLDASERLSPEEYVQMVQNLVPHLLIDVRNSHELLISSVSFDKTNSMRFLNIPIKSLLAADDIASYVASIKSELSNVDGSKQVVIICKRGNNSQKALQMFKDVGLHEQLKLKDVKGGLCALKGLLPNVYIY